MNHSEKRKQLKSIKTAMLDNNYALKANQLLKDILKCTNFSAPRWEYLTEEEAAKLLQIEERTLRLWRKQRGVPHFKLTAKVIRYSRTDLADWMGQFRVPVRTTPKGSR